MRYCFYPQKRLTVEPTKNSIGIGKAQASYQTIPTHWREGGKEGAKVRVCFTARDTPRWLAAG